MSKYAVIDIGTNTCNLLIAKVNDDNSFQILYDRKLPVKLGRGGIQKNLLLPDAIARGMKALQGHSATLKEYNVEKLKIIGTSALRGAVNNKEFTDKAKELLNWDITIIDGETEAGLIFRGVQLSLPATIGKYLIVDIGGGSIEFILGLKDKIIWKQSFNIGIARALEAFQLSDPITGDEIKMLEHWFDIQLGALWNIIPQHQPLVVVGCAGAFDTFMDIFEETEPEQKIRSVSELPLNDFQHIHQRLIESDQETRSEIKGMDKMRVDMVVIASIFTNFILGKVPTKMLLHTPYSLKEGVMDQLICEE